MTQYEMAMLAQEYWSNGISVSAIVMTKMSGYLMVAYEARSVEAEAPDTYLAYFVTSFLIFCFFASPKFMWDVRHRTSVDTLPPSDGKNE